MEAFVKLAESTASTEQPLKIGSSRMKNAPSIAASAGEQDRLARAWPPSAHGVGERRARRDLKSTSRIELRTMMPASAIMPIIEVAVNCAPSSAWPGITPMMVSGIGAMMISGIR